MHRAIALTLLTTRCCWGPRGSTTMIRSTSSRRRCTSRMPKSRKLNDFYDLYQNTFGQPGERHSKKKRSPELIPSQAVNTLDEVPDDPAWFINRIGAHKNERRRSGSRPGERQVAFARRPMDDCWSQDQRRDTRLSNQRRGREDVFAQVRPADQSRNGYGVGCHRSEVLPRSRLTTLPRTTL